LSDFIQIHEKTRIIEEEKNERNSFPVNKDNHKFPVNLDSSSASLLSILRNGRSTMES
jgi:hypothetical protein